MLALAWTLFNAVLIILVSFAPDALITAGRAGNSAQSTTSLMMWATMASVPLGGRIIEMFGHATLWIICTLILSVAAIIAIAQGQDPEVSFIALGLVFGIPAGAIMSLTTETMTAEHRGPALGIFYTWYYTGMTLAPALAGWTRDVSGKVAAPLLLAAVMTALVAMAIGLLRLLQKVWTIETNPHP